MTALSPIVIAFGLWYVVGYSAISYPARAWFRRTFTSRWPLELIQCPACFGFWEGVVLAATRPHSGVVNTILAVAATGLTFLTTNLVLASITRTLETRDE